MARTGHFYAARIFEKMGLCPKEGAVRLSFAHYTSKADVAKAIKALEEVL